MTSHEDNAITFLLKFEQQNLPANISPDKSFSSLRLSQSWCCVELSHRFKLLRSSDVKSREEVVDEPNRKAAWWWCRGLAADEVISKHSPSRLIAFGGRQGCRTYNNQHQARRCFSSRCTRDPKQPSRSHICLERMVDTSECCPAACLYARRPPSINHIHVVQDLHDGSAARHLMANNSHTTVIPCFLALFVDVWSLLAVVAKL